MVSSSSGVDGSPVVSVLMTAFNRERYIGDAIESVLASTFTDLELIIVDDGSRDRTVEVAQGFAMKDRRVRVYVNEKNLGDYPNRNKAASYATGKYLKYVDADDYIYPWGVELLVRMMEKFPEAGWGLCSLPQVKERPYPFQLSPKEAYEHHYFGPGLFHKAPLSAILVRSAFEKLGGFSGMRMVGDSEMWHRMAMHYPVVLMPDGMVWYREHDSQEANSIRQFVVTYEEVVYKALKDPRCPLSKEQVRQVVSRRKKQSMRFGIYHLCKWQFGKMVDSMKILSFYQGK
jgi:glycosyltransferase involved in cell wall biosynthesis